MQPLRWVFPWHLQDTTQRISSVYSNSFASSSSPGQCPRLDKPPKAHYRPNRRGSAQICQVMLPLRASGRPARGGRAGRRGGGAAAAAAAGLPSPRETAAGIKGRCGGGCRSSGRPRSSGVARCGLLGSLCKCGDGAGAMSGVSFIWGFAQCGFFLPIFFFLYFCGVWVFCLFSPPPLRGWVLERSVQGELLLSASRPLRSALRGLPLSSLVLFPPAFFFFWGGGNNSILRAGLYQLSPLCCTGRSRGG